MAEVDIFRPLGAKDTGVCGGSRGSLITADEEFEPCISGTTSNFPSSTGEFSSPRNTTTLVIQKNNSKNPPSLHLECSTHPVKVKVENSVVDPNISGCRSRYGLEPMGLFYGYPDARGESKEDGNKDKNQKTGQGRNQVMSAMEPMRPSISLRKIGEYDLGKTIGSGSTGKVKLATHRHTKESLAVKIIPRTPLEASRKPTKETTESRERRILREAAILYLIDHEHIVKLRDFLITTDYFCLFFEHVEGVQLLDYIIMHGKLKEAKARHFFRQILSAVDYCHHNSIVHRDLKIENILVEENSERVKLLDFGLSNFYQPDNNLNTFCGSLYFAAPELLRGQTYTGPEVDVWSLGVILYVLVTGRVPFDDKNLAALHEKIKACRLQIPEYISDSCQELLFRMICKEPSERATMDDVIFHPWVNGGYDTVPAYLPPERLPLDNVDPRIVAFLQRDFDIQYKAEEINSILQQASQDWTSAFRHPVVSLYFLARDKLLRDGSPVIASVKVDCKERSRSLSYIAEANPRFNSGIDMAHPSETHHKTGRHWSIPGSSTSPSNPIVVTSIEGEICTGQSPEILPCPEDSLKKLNSGERRKSDADGPPIRRPSSPLARRRAASVFETVVAPPLARPEDESLGIRTVYLKGFFSLSSTTSRPPTAIRAEIQAYLIRHGIRYEDRRSYFVCEHRPSIIRTTEVVTMGLSLAEQQTPLDRVLFEVHIVRLAFIGLHGIQLKRIHGDISHYKHLCAQLLAGLKL